MKKKITKIQSLVGRTSPCWVKVKFSSDSDVGTDDYVYGIAYYAKDERAWYILQNVARGNLLPTAINSGLKYSWEIGTGSIYSIKQEAEISELYILPRKPRTKEFKDINLKPKKALEITINDDYTATIFTGYIKVGCQTISNDIIRNLCKQLID